MVRRCDSSEAVAGRTVKPEFLPLPQKQSCSTDEKKATFQLLERQNRHIRWPYGQRKHRVGATEMTRGYLENRWQACQPCRQSSVSVAFPDQVVPAAWGIANRARVPRRYIRIRIPRQDQWSC